MTIVGYARVSTAGQELELELELQRDALGAAGATKVFEDIAGGARADRPGLAAALAYLRDGDVLTVWKLDRLGRSLPHLIETAEDLRTRGVGLKSLTEEIDTTSPGGKLIFSIFGEAGCSRLYNPDENSRPKQGQENEVSSGRSPLTAPVISVAKIAIH